MVDMGEIIKIVPFGDIDSGLLTGIAEEVDRAFLASVTVADAQQPDESAYNPVRSQYSAEALLKYTYASDSRMLGITHVDLYLPDLNYVFGFADKTRHAAIVSIARFKRGNGKMVERAVKTSIHELGHIYGLAHCQNNRCVMYFSFNLTDTDYKGKEFCDKCQKALSNARRETA